MGGVLIFFGTTQFNISRASWETQGQIVGARESLNRRENMARREAPIRSQHDHDSLELVW